jgi:hypothetical protein
MIKYSRINHVCCLASELPICGSLPLTKNDKVANGTRDVKTKTQVIRVEKNLLLVFIALSIAQRRQATALHAAEEGSAEGGPNSAPLQGLCVSAV